MAEDRKLHIDDDWKSQAAAEKERLTKQVEREPGPARAPASGFHGLVNLLAMQCVAGLGGLAGPGGEPIPPDLNMAKFHIDLLDILDQKTKGNLTAEEKALLDNTLHQLRMMYVEVVNAAMHR